MGRSPSSHEGASSLHDNPAVDRDPAGRNNWRRRQPSKEGMKNCSTGAPTSHLVGLVAALVFVFACAPAATSSSPPPTTTQPPSFVPPPRRDPKAAPSPSIQTDDPPPCQCVAGDVGCAIKCQAANRQTNDQRPPFSGTAADQALDGARAGAVGCSRPGGPKGTAIVHVQIEPSGRTSDVTIAPPFAGTPTGNCIRTAFRGVRIPAFSGGAVVMRKEVPIR